MTPPTTEEYAEFKRAELRRAAGLGSFDDHLASEIDALIDELSESPLPGARYAVAVVRRRLGRAPSSPYAREACPVCGRRPNAHMRQVLSDPSLAAIAERDRTEDGLLIGYDQAASDRRYLLGLIRASRAARAEFEEPA